MSATNRGAKRVDSDFYATPESVVRNFLKHHHLQKGDVLECTAGNGNISKIIKEIYPKMKLDAVELREGEKESLEEIADKVFISDFLEWKPNKNKKYRTIITNPPYSIAQEVIERCFEIADEETEIIMLLRVNFLGSQKRFDFWQKHPLSSLYVMSKRPSFTGKGTDATEYAWFVWNGEPKGVKVIEGK